MPSALNALPTITGTALGASLATGIPAGQYKAPTAVVGYMVPMDSLNFYVQAQDLTSGNLFGVSATATSGQTCGNQTNTVHRGLTFYIKVVSLSVNSVTIGLTLNGVNPLDALTYPLAKVSLDGLIANGNYGIQMYPGLTQTGGTGQTFAQGSAALPAVFNVTTSLTITTTASMTGTLGYFVGYSKSV